MKNSKVIYRTLLGLVIVQAFLLIGPRLTYSQTEVLDIIEYSPPAGWARSYKDGATLYTDLNNKTGSYCVIAIYASTASAGPVQKDFATSWSRLVVGPFKAGAVPKTDIQSDPAGWQGAVGAAPIETDAGLKGIAVLTVYSGFGRTASILAILNDESYLAKADAFVAGVKLQKPSALPVQKDPPAAAQRDPFPDKPGYQPQKPLAGLLKESITMADLAGTWDHGAGGVTTYVDSGSGNYAGTDTTFYSESYTIRANGTFDHRFAGRTANHTVRETATGTITLSGGTITVKYTSGSTYRYQFISFMELANGGAVLSLVQIGQNDPLYDGNWLVLECGHGQGYIRCAGGEEWTQRLPAR